MKHPVCLLAVTLSLAGISLSTGRAELPAQLKTMMKTAAESFDEAMKGYDASVETRMKVDRDTYLLALGQARKVAEGAKRMTEVVAIDAEIKAVSAGAIAGEPGTDFPKDPLLLRYRKQFATASERANNAVESSRRFARESHLKWLDGMDASAKRGKSAELEAAVATERQRVLATESKAAKPDAPASPKPPTPDTGK